MVNREWLGSEWDRWGRQEPYYGVVSRDEFRGARMDDTAREKFFRTGEADMATTFALVRSAAGPEFRPRRALDFGCGVGRLTIPLARVATEVVGVDVSSAMIAEARANCQRAGLGNVRFSGSAPGFPEVDGTFDFVHSYIVFQHIPTDLGYRLFEDLLDRLEPNGAGMLHFTFNWRVPVARRLLHRARSSSGVLHRLLNVVQGRPIGAPMMAGFAYDIGRLMSTLRARGFDRVAGQLTDHGGWEGLMLAFARTENAG